MERSNLRRALGTLVLMLTSLSVSLVLGEGVLRAWSWFVRAEPPRARGEIAGLPELSGVMQLASPNTLGIYKGQVHRTNRFGFRGPELSVDKPADVFRIVVIGDSFTMGEGVPEEATYTSRLQRRLRDGGAHRFEVLNLGLSGLNLRQLLDHRLPIGLRFAPDLLVYGFTINDLEGLPGYRLREQRTHRPSPLEFLDLLVHLAWSRLAERLALPGSYMAELTENFADSAPAWLGFQSDLRRLADVGADLDVCVVMLIHTHPSQLDDFHPLEPFYERVATAGERLGIFPVSSLAFFLGLDPARLTIGPLDSHPNEEGHRLLSEALAAGLLALPERCWRGFTPLGSEATRAVQ